MGKRGCSAWIRAFQLLCISNAGASGRCQPGGVRRTETRVITGPIVNVSDSEMAGAACRGCLRRAGCESKTGAGSSWLRLIGRLAIGIERAQAEAELGVIYQRYRDAIAASRAAKWSADLRKRFIAQKFELRTAHGGWTNQYFAARRSRNQRSAAVSAGPAAAGRNGTKSWSETGISADLRRSPCWRGSLSAHGAEFPFEHRGEDLLPPLLLARDGLLGFKPLLQAQTGRRFAEAQDSGAVGQLDQEHFNVAFHGASVTLKPELFQHLVQRCGRMASLLCGASVW